MPMKDIHPNAIERDQDWAGNNAAFTCPACGKVFIVSGIRHKAGRSCPECGRSKGYVKGGKESGGSARIEWDQSN